MFRLAFGKSANPTRLPPIHNWGRDETHQEKQRDRGRRLQVRAESQQAAVAIFHHELAAVPWRVVKSPSEFHALGGVLGIEKEWRVTPRRICSG